MLLGVTAIGRLHPQVGAVDYFGASLQQLSMSARNRWSLCVLAVVWLGIAAAEQSYSGEECVGVVDFPLVEAANITELDAIVKATLTNRAVYPVWLTEKCHAANRRRVCLMTYDGLSESSSQQTCKDVCEETIQDCKAYFRQAQKATGNDLAALLSAQCAALPTESCLRGGTAQTAHTDDAIECPYPLVVPDSRSEHYFVKMVDGSGCAIPCPSFLLTEDERTISNDVSLLLLIIGSVGSSITAYAYKKREVSSTNLVVWTSLVSFLCSIVTLAYVAADFNHDITCQGNSGFNVRGDFCVSQAAIFMFCFLEFQYLNLFSIFQLWAAMMMTVPKATLDLLRKWYLPVSTVIIAGSVASMYSQDALGFEWAVPRPFCFYIRNTGDKVRDGASEGEVLFWVFIYGPTACAAAMSLCLTSHALYRVNRVLKQSEQLAQRTAERIASVSQGAASGRRKSLSNMAGFRKRLSYNQRTFKFLLTFVISSLIYLPLMYYLLAVKEADYQESMLDLIGCLLTHAKEGGQSADTAHDICGENPTDRPDIWMYQYVLFYLSAFGICVFLVYGSSGRISRTVSKLATRLRTHSPASQQMTEYKTSSARMSPRANKSPLPPRPTRSPFNSSNDDVYNRDSAL